MVERVHPVVPEFRGSPVGRPATLTEERRGQLLLVYFTPWVLEESLARPPYVVHARDLQAGEGPEKKSWQAGLKAYVERGCLCQEVRQTMQNFMLTFMVRYSTATEEEETDEGEDDVELQPYGAQFL